MTMNFGILAFNDMEELDALGPWEVLAWAAKQEQSDMTVCTIGSTGREITCGKGLRIVTDFTLDDHPSLDVILVPGGQGTRPIFKDGGVEIDWIKKVAPGCTWVTSVCTGALLLHRAGYLKGKRATTHWGATELLRNGGDVEVLENVRYVRDGNVVTSAGISAGMDMSLWLLGQIYDADFARFVQKGIEYFPAPPYTAEV
ncbi:DJ-1/PfpI family protein [Thalassospiraceae bacterium LMO-JJ14]|nr:DJ-1/PfpI family protein [Thalassospiraceae bacterium LMO-JJ14]